MYTNKQYKDIAIKNMILRLSKVFTILALLFFAWSAYDSVAANSNAFSSKPAYNVICVNNGDTLWTIAAKCTNEKEDIRNKVIMIKQLKPTKE